jgi:hypothetical protein
MRALAIVLAILLVMPVLASAKSVAYVTNQSVAGFPCTSLTGEDKLFCQRLEKLGYQPGRVDTRRYAEPGREL